MTCTVSGLLLCDVKQGPDLLFRSLHDRKQGLSCGSQKIKVSSVVTLQVSAAEEVRVQALCAMNYLQCRVCGAHQVKRFSSAQSDGKMRLYRLVGSRWSVSEGFFHHSFHHRSKTSDLTPERNCCSSRPHERSFAALFLQQLGCISFFMRGILGGKFLPPKSDGKGGYGKNCLGPGSPFALRNAEGAREPAAVVNRIGHVTSPVNCREIVCGGMA